MGRNDGFSLIEVLVVIVVIGILAAIAIPNLVKHTDKANDTGAKSAVAGAQIAMRSLGVDRDGFTDATAADLVEIDSGLSEVNSEGRLMVSGTASAAPTKTSYVVAVKAKKTDTWFAFYQPEGSSGSPMRFCAPAGGAGGCGNAIPGVSFPGFGTVGSW